MTRIIRLLSLPVLLFVFTACPVEPPVGSIENPLVLDTYVGSEITHVGTVGAEHLYIQVINIPFLDNAHGVTLTGLTGGADLYTFSDAFVTPEGISATVGTGDEACTGTTTATGELYIMIDGTVSTGSKTFTLYAGT